MKAEEIKALAFDEAPNDIVRALCMSWCFSKYIPQNAEQHRAAVLEPAIKAAIDAENEIRRLRACVAELEAHHAAAELDRLREQVDTLTHQVICCGVAASHNDATLTTRGEYAGKWDSAQADQVRKLRAENKRLKYREKNCATENHAMLVSAVRFMQEAAAIVGMGSEASPADVLAALQSLKHGSDSFHGIQSAR